MQAVGKEKCGNGCKNVEQACLIILAGGKGTRLGGQGKAWLEIGGQPLVERILTSLGPLFAQWVVVRGAGRLPAGQQALPQQDAGGMAPEPAGHPGLWPGGEVELTADLFPGYGPLAGIHAGLLTSRHPYNLVVACDMPFTDPRLAAYLLEQAHGYEVVVPRIDGLLEPLFAVYSRDCLGPVQRSLEAGNRRAYDFYSQVRVRYVDEEEIDRITSRATIFFNINTPQELKKARAMASPERGRGD